MRFADRCIGNRTYGGGKEWGDSPAYSVPRKKSFFRFHIYPFSQIPCYYNLTPSGHRGPVGMVSMERLLYMDDNKPLFIAIAVIIAVLALPIVVRALRGNTPVTPVAAPAANVAANPYTPTPPATAPPTESYPAADNAAPPQQYTPAGPKPLDANSLPGTSWEMSSPYGKVQVQFGGGGQATAYHPMAGTIPASWRIQGNQLLATASAMGQTLNLSAEIRGNQLYYNGLAAK